jgi:phage terminase large subunit-like protein
MSTLPRLIETLRQSKMLTPDRLREFVSCFSTDEITALLSDWDQWSLPYQQLPPGNWRRWSFRAGRGAGKTHTGARTTNEVARDRDKIRTGEIGIIGRTHADARHTMVEGPSGILAQAPPDFRPTWEPGNGILIWPNKVKGRIFSADKPQQLRGPNLAFAWADEPAHWPDAEATWWTVIEPAIRIGWARAMLTSTPIPDPFLQKLEADPNTVLTRASTFDNCYLPKSVLEMFRTRYEGTRIGQQELHGEFLEDNERALWKAEQIEQHRVMAAPNELRRVVIAVDPAVTATAKSDETGIVIVGIDFNGHAFVLDDRSGRFTPSQWGRTAVAAYHRFEADAIVPEVNNGGDLVVSNIYGIDSRVKVKPVRASRGKVVRAEPVAALYERGLVHHVGHFPVLETQLTNWDPSVKESPDRLDALVWALHELLLTETNAAGPLKAYLP